MKSQKTLLLTAYAINPYKGSEDGTGWNISAQLARKNMVHVVTRRNNRAQIEQYLKEFPSAEHANMHFYYYDLPNWIMQWKYRMGERGYVAYFYLWQLFLPFFVRRLNIQFDLAHAVNFHSDSHPQFLWLLGKPVFWGPIGHHPPVPSAFLQPVYGRKKWLKDRLYNWVKGAMRSCDPFYYVSKWTAKRIFVINSGVNKAVRANAKKIILLPAVAHTVQEKVAKPMAETAPRFEVLAVGRFVYMKGFDVTIRSFARFYRSLSAEEKVGVGLCLVGKGEELDRMKKLIKFENIEAVTRIVQWVEKDKMEAIYQRASVFCFGSHEGAGMVVPEALGNGLPVVCFDNYGPGELCDKTCAIKVPYGAYEEAINGFAEGLHTLFSDSELYKTYAKNAVAYARSRFQWNVKARIINEAYALVG